MMLKVNILNTSILLLMLMLLLVKTVSANEAVVEGCGSLENAYGPFDYTNTRHREVYLQVVERHHFTSNVERHVRGQEGSVASDLDYTLRAFPNHHKALYSMAIYEINNSKAQGRDKLRLTADCYFMRAMRFKYDDTMVRMIYGIYLHKKGKFQEALERYKEALTADNENGELYYNIGLSYLKLNDYEQARKNAVQAYKYGYPLQGLKKQLKEKGEWK